MYLDSVKVIGKPFSCGIWKTKKVSFILLNLERTPLRKNFEGNLWGFHLCDKVHLKKTEAKISNNQFASSIIMNIWMINCDWWKNKILSSFPFT